MVFICCHPLAQQCDGNDTYSLFRRTVYISNMTLKPVLKSYFAVVMKVAVWGRPLGILSLEIDFMHGFSTHWD